ncbi:P14 [Pseudomonas phage phi2954]|uniref:p14 n=1 Tax=Pseudomonas phage phi2954 TaxID=593131 RepID=C0KIT4_9VIRU|nr:P14 [Pseudomonas phage phi2954]ACM91119.1 P14 [Pseudomonas phage phi2954]
MLKVQCYECGVIFNYYNEDDNPPCDSETCDACLDKFEEERITEEDGCLK